MWGEEEGFVFVGGEEGFVFWGEGGGLCVRGRRRRRRAWCLGEEEGFMFWGEEEGTSPHLCGRGEEVADA